MKFKAGDIVQIDLNQDDVTEEVFNSWKMEVNKPYPIAYIITEEQYAVTNDTGNQLIMKENWIKKYDKLSKASDL